MLGDIYVLPFWPPFLTFWGLNTIFLGYFFLSTNTKKLILGTNPSRITSFWPQIPLCLDLLGSNFQRPVAHPHQSPDLVPHTPHPHPHPITHPPHRGQVCHLWLFSWYSSFAICIHTNIHGLVAFPVLLPIDIENLHHYWNVLYR